MAEARENTSGPLVLVGDDEEMMLDLVCDVLREAGFRTVTASDGAEVIELVHRHQPVLIVLDVMMPKMDGYTALTRLRSHPMTSEVPVIVLTGQVDPVYRALSEGVGAVAHVTKPFSPQQLVETVKRILAERTA
jgi:two-component system sensor kinase FixL